MNIVLILQNTTYQSLRKCSVHQAAYKNVQKHFNKSHSCCLMSTSMK